MVDELEFSHQLETDGYQPEFEPEETSGPALQLEEYLSGSRKDFDLAIDLSSLPPFPRVVLQTVAKVPYGEVRSYSDIASDVGKQRAARAVGSALSQNPASLFIPCHRIIRSDGTLGEYGERVRGRSATEIKRRLLRLEGVNL
jgi:methylated-DNA-[protein]-cysteine S-methyltransferase